MKTRSLILAIAFLSVAAGCAIRPTPRGVVVRPAPGGYPSRAARPATVWVVAVKPPPVRPAVVVARPARPGGAYLWRGGHYTWTRGRYRWVSGAWALPPAGKREWVPGLWNTRGSGGVWVAGYWA